MMVWRYIIKSEVGNIITQDPEYAEKRSRLGNIVFCKRESNAYRFNH